MKHTRTPAGNVLPAARDETGLAFQAARRGGDVSALASFLTAYPFALHTQQHPRIDHSITDSSEMDANEVDRVFFTELSS